MFFLVSFFQTLSLTVSERAVLDALVVLEVVGRGGWTVVYWLEHTLWLLSPIWPIEPRPQLRRVLWLSLLRSLGKEQFVGAVSFVSQHLLHVYWTPSFLQLCPAPPISLHFEMK